ncbi:uncharacterized protein LOC114452986 isoform X3 [Parambassis ranga]|uniref:Uncharacterized protein LOC114452986 isoform X3 n=1 Tax=Parambassis ranga TaxID=210632 RepID=A0A6P7KLW1_9TELE|nr:uncharacterized protein LOC114452986 isoform X3 [Parambassis ranga]
MSNVQFVRNVITERLTAAAAEIFGVFEQTVVQYEEEIERQRKLLDIFLKPQIKLHRIDGPQQHAYKLGEALADQQLCNQERNSSLDQKKPEPPQILEELCANNEGEQMVLMQDLSIETAANDGSHHSEPNCNVAPTYNSTDTDLEHLHDTICRQKSMRLEDVNIVAGDFNDADLRAMLHRFHQHSVCTTIAANRCLAAT